MDRRLPGAEPSAEQTAVEIPAQRHADEQYRRVQTEVGERARTATTMAEVATVAEFVGVLKQHRPRTYDLVSSSDTSGDDYREHGFATADGGFIGLEEPRVLCGGHDDLTDWPCPDFAALVARLQGVARHQGLAHLEGRPPLSDRAPLVRSRTPK